MFRFMHKHVSKCGKCGRVIAEPKENSNIFRSRASIKLGRTVNKRRLFILSFSIVCVVIIAVGLLYWYSEQVAEQKLQGYIERLEKRGYTVEEHSLSEFHVDDSVTIRKFIDFTQDAYWKGVDHIYFDRKIHGLYFLSSIQGDRIKATVFHYKWKL